MISGVAGNALLFYPVKNRILVAINQYFLYFLYVAAGFAFQP